MTRLPLAEPEWLFHVDHTADECIEVVAPSPAVLFERLAAGWMLVVASPHGIEPREAWQVEVEGSDPEELLVNWLGELNFRHQCFHLVFAAFSVLEYDGSVLRAEIRGEAIDPTRHEILAEVKAVTYHHLRLAQEADGWRGRVLFDM